MKYRIVKVEYSDKVTLYKIQKKVLSLFWMNVMNGTSEGSAGPLLLNDIELAEKLIDKLMNPITVNSEQVVKEYYS